VISPPARNLSVNFMKRSFEGSVYKSKERKGWIARLRYTDSDGVKREKKRVCLTHSIAQAKIRQLRREIEADNADRKTFRQLDEFFRNKYVHEARFVGGKKISGFRQKLVAVEHYMDAARDYFGDRYIDSITYSDLQLYKDKIVNQRTIHGRERSVSDTNLFLKRLRRLFNIAIEQGWLTVNPFARGESLIKESFEVERTRILSGDEELRLLNACTGKRAHLRPLLIFAIETACRKNEILSLRWSSVDLNRRCIRIESQNTKTLKSRLVRSPSAWWNYLEYSG
jgi:integrase